MPGFGVVAHKGALGSDGVGGILDLPRQRFGARQAEHVLRSTTPRCAGPTPSIAGRA